ncbi:MAG: AMP-binding protein [Pseudomonadota bacterium]
MDQGDKIIVNANTLPEQTWLQRLQQLSQEQPAAVALQAPGKAALTYAALVEEIRRQRQFLKSLGLSTGSRVAIICPDSPEMATACLSLSTDAVCVPLNPAYTAGDIRYFLKRLTIEMVIIHHSLGTPARAVARALAIPCIELVADSELAGVFRFSCQEAEPLAAFDDAPAPRANQVGLILHTSGSTARPKIVALNHGQLTAAACHIAEVLQLTPKDRCLSLLPMFHVGALVDLLLTPLLTGGSVVVAGGMTASRFFECLDEFSPSWTQAVPTMLRDIMDKAGQMTPRPQTSCLRLLRSVSSPLDPALHTRAEQLLNVPVIEIYGMTETSGQICSNPLPPAVRKPGSVGKPVGVQLQLINAQGNPVRDGERGEVIVRGPGVISAYEGDAAINAESFVSGWLRTGDEGYLDEDGYLFLTGRLKDIINRGGEKISPSEIDEVLLGHPDVKEAAAFAMPHASLGEEVAVSVVPVDAKELNTQIIRDYAALHLASFKVPRKVFLLDALPRTAAGKLQRHRVPAAVGLTQANPAASDFMAPVTAAGKLLASLWQQALAVERVGLHDNFFDLGGDSLGAAAFIEALESHIDGELPVSALYDAPTVAEFEALLTAQGLSMHQSELSSASPPSAGLLRTLSRRSATWQGVRHHPQALLVGQNTLGAKPPVFWIADSDVWLNQLAAELGPDQPVYSMRNLWGTPQHSRDQAAIDYLAAHFVTELAAVYPEGSCIVGGFCEGGKVAAVAARNLLHQGRHVSLLCLAEHFLTERYPGRVAYYFTRGSRFSPYTSFRRPELGWRKLHKGTTAVSVYDWSHNAFIQEQNTALFARQLGKDITATDTPPAEPWPDTQLLTPQDYRSSLRSNVSRWLPVDCLERIHMIITNESDATWRSAEYSAIGLYADWEGPNERRILNRCGELQQSLPPGDTIEVWLSVKVPDEPGRWRLRLCLVEEGVRWFSELDQGYSEHLVTVSKSARLARRLRALISAN